MGKRNNSDTPNYHAESRGEKRDRLEGTSDREKMHAARKADIELAKEMHRRRLINAYLTSVFFSFLMLIIAIATVAWWVYDYADQTISVEGNKIERQQLWGVSMTGISVKIVYCRTDIDSCSTERDQFRYFDDQKNDELKWPENWQTVAADAFSASNLFIACIVLSVCCTIFTTGVVGLVFCGSMNRKLLVAAWITIISGELILVFGTFMFVTGLADFISQLKTDNFVENLVSELEYGFSLWLMLVSIGCQIPMIILVYHIIPERKEDQAAILAELSDKIAERRKRSNQYFTDIENGSHIYESDPTDSHSGAKTAGWTQYIDSEETNVLHEEDDESTRKLRVCLAFSKDPTGLQHPVESNAGLPSRAGVGKDNTPEILRDRPAELNGFDVTKTLRVNVQKLNRLPPLPGSLQPPSPTELEPESVEDDALKPQPLERQKIKKAPPPLPKRSARARAALNLKSPPARAPEKGFKLPSTILGSATKVHLHSCQCEACVEARMTGLPGVGRIDADAVPEEHKKLVKPPPLPQVLHGKASKMDPRPPTAQRKRPVSRAPKPEKDVTGKSRTHGEVVVTQTVASQK